MSDDRRDLVGLSRAELMRELVVFGEKPFRAKQLWHWIYSRGATDFAMMTTLSKASRERLAASYVVGRPSVENILTSRDNTRKWLVRFADGNEAECVYIPEQDRGALCISSQVGCTLTCPFCRTGTQRLVRNLTAPEIVSQMMLARDSCGDWSSPAGERIISNIVMMGMGEPLFNFDNVARALTVIMDPEGISLSKRRITLSTSGVVPLMERCGKELGVNLAVSLHAPTDELRDVLVPINRKHPLNELLAACRAYPGANNARRITFEYVMLKDVNDSIADARELIRRIRGIPAKFNLIPFNGWPGAPYECSNRQAIQRFAATLNDSGYSSPIRVSRGRDILAACGQLRSNSERVQEFSAAKPAEAAASFK